MVILTIEKQRPTALPTLIEYFTVTDSATGWQFAPNTEYIIIIYIHTAMMIYKFAIHFLTNVFS